MNWAAFVIGLVAVFFVAFVVGVVTSNRWGVGYGFSAGVILCAVYVATCAGMTVGF